MATNLQIDTNLLDEAQKIGGFRTKRETVNFALEQYVMRQKRLALLELRGAIEYEPDYDYKKSRGAS